MIIIFSMFLSNTALVLSYLLAHLRSYNKLDFSERHCLHDFSSHLDRLAPAPLHFIYHVRVRTLRLKTLL